MSDASPGLATTRAIKLWYLKRFPLFHGFTPDELYDVLRSTQMREVDPGQPLYLPGESGTHRYLLKRGVVKVSRLMADGREVTLALLKPGDVFGEVEVVGDQPYETQAITHQDLASVTGSVRETVSDVLGEFRNRGWVALERKRVAVRDRAALRRVMEAM